MRRWILAGLLALGVAASGCATNPFAPRPARVPEVTTLASQPPHLFPAAVVFPLLLKGERKGEGAAFGWRLGDALLTQGVAVSVLSDERYPQSAAEALAFAREAKSDIAVLGEIDEFFHGGITASSRVRASVTVLDVASGATLWRLSGQHADFPVPPRDRYFFLSRGREADSPVRLADELALEMAKVLAGHPTPMGPPPPPRLPEPETLSPRDAGAWKSY